MRRKHDGWVNATHILKVADFPKPHRTRILERDVQKGVHEKVQGGYGKYQGTWVPLEKAKQIAAQFSVGHLLDPLFRFDVAEEVTGLQPMPKRSNASAKRDKSGAKDGNTATSGLVDVNDDTKKRGKKKPPEDGPKPKRKYTRKAKPVNSIGNPGVASSGVSFEPSDYPSEAPVPPAQSSVSLSNSVPNSVPNSAADSQVSFGMNFPEPEDDVSSTGTIPDPQDVANVSVELGKDTSTEYPASFGPPSDSASPSASPASSSSEFMSDDDLDAALRTPQSAARLPPGSQLPFQLSDRTSGSAGSGNPANPANSIDSQYPSFASPRISSQVSQHHVSLRSPVSVPGNGTASGSIRPVKSRHAGRLDAGQDYASRLLDFFLTADSDAVPEFLRHPPPSFNVNQIIDDQRHTAFHWACALGNLSAVEILLNAGADIHALNAEGQTPLARAVSFTNAYEKRTFARLVDWLRDSLLSVDAQHRRTIFHHVARATEVRAKWTAARYYLEIVLGKLSELQPLEVITNLLNEPDAEGETALQICARYGARKCVRVLLRYGAKDSGAATASQSIESRNVAEGSKSGISGLNSWIAGRFGAVAEPRLSETAMKAAQRLVPEFFDMLSRVVVSMDEEMARKNSDVDEVRRMLASMHSEWEATQRLVEKEFVEKYGSGEDIRESGEDVRNGEDSGTKKAVTALEAIIAEEEQKVAAKMAELTAVLERSQQRALREAVKAVKTESAAKVKVEAESGSGSEKVTNGAREISERQESTNAESGDSEASGAENTEGNSAISAQLGEETVAQVNAAVALSELQLERRGLIAEIVRLYADAGGVGSKMNQYRRLVSVSCGVAPEDLDELLDGIAQALAGDNPEADGSV